LDSGLAMLAPHRPLPPSYPPSHIFGKVIDCRQAGTADLESPFVVVRSESTWGPMLHTAIIRSDFDGKVLENSYYTRDLTTDQYIVSRTGFLIEGLHDTIESTYQDYLLRKRADEKTIAVCRKQDRDHETALRTVHFMSGILHGPFLSHVQVQLSRSPKTPLNMEEHIGKLPRKEGELWAEMGRLNIKDIEALFGHSESSVMPTDARTGLRLHVWQTMINYLAWDVKPDVVVTQANSAVRDILLKQKLLVFDSRPAEGHPDEWVVTLSPTQLKQTQENLAREKLIWSLENKLKERLFSLTDETLIADIPLSGRDALVRLGLVRPVPKGPSRLVDQPPPHWRGAIAGKPSAVILRAERVPIEVDRDEYFSDMATSLYVSTDEARRLLQFLKSKRPK